MVPQICAYQLSIMGNPICEQIHGVCNFNRAGVKPAPAREIRKGGVYPRLQPSDFA